MIKRKFIALLSTTFLISGLLFQTQNNVVFAERDEGSDNIQHVYHATGATKSQTLTNDKLSSEQWALYNNGRFKMEAEQNKYPVFENSFQQRMNPGKWARPSKPKNGQKKMPNNTIKTVSIPAEAGIDINISEAWKLYKSQRNVTVAIIDTGIDFNHEDLSNVMWVNQDEIAGNNTDDDGNGYVDDIYGWNFYNNNNNIYVGEEDDHGTHEAGTITATKDNSVGITGIADEDSVSIMSLKVLGGEDGSGTTESIINAIKYADANGASICNLSLGTTSYDQALYDAMANSNMLFVVAAGNGDSEGGTNIDFVPTYPAAFDLNNIISVANVSCDGNLSSSSNYGKNSVDIAAPGSYILGLTADNGYAYMSGTSMAAPMVTAVAALVYTGNADLSLSDVKEAILTSATPLDTLTGKVSSGGLLNAGLALKYTIK
ncbi:MAG: S8 family peptidase [Aminipila sp.]